MQALFAFIIVLVFATPEGVASPLAAPVLEDDNARLFEFNYHISANNFPPGVAVDVYIPLPARHSGQQLLSQSVQSSISGVQGRDARFGNDYYHISRPANSSTPIEVSISWTVSREVVSAGDDTEVSDADYGRYLAANALVPVGHSVLAPILAEVYELRADDSKEATARAIYDWIVDNVEYKKVGTGWGNGDTYWACNERYGNCTDFHALFISLARSEGIPARFEIGFPVPVDRAEGEVGGYHCWVQFYLPGRGWVPIDASEAVKHPEHREMYYGTHPADRIHFTTGRDIVVSEGSAKKPLNYFIYPYVEIDGKAWAEKLATRFSYRELESQ